jgi:hypothetical protein
MSAMARRSLALLPCIALALAWVDDARATEVGRSKDFGLGIAIGDPTSIVAKYFVSPENAFDFGLGFWRVSRGCRGPDDDDICDEGGFGRLTFNMDYLWQQPIISGSGAKLDWHIGAGGRVWLWDDAAGGDFALAARMPLGLDVTFPKPDFLEVFLELAPAVYVVPGLYLDFDVFLGVRFYF